MDKRERAVSHREAFDKLSFVPGVRDILIMTAETIGVSALVAYGFFDSPIGLISAIPIGVLNLHRYCGRCDMKREETIRAEFKEILLSVASSIRTGYSVENAFSEAGEVLNNMYGESSILLSDVDEMNRCVGMHVSVERAFLDIVKKYPLDEIESFGEIFLYTKRLGGGYARYLKDTADRLEERITLRSELDAMIAQKKLELSIMSVMPMAILIYMKLTGGSFLAPLYHNAFGVILMSVCLCIYAGSVALGNYMITKVMNSL